MNRLTTVLTVALAAGAGAGAFLGTFYGTSAPPGEAAGPAPASPPIGDGEAVLSRWLHLNTDQAAAVRQADPNFQSEAAALHEKMHAEAAALAGLLESPTASDGQILAQVERAIAAHNDLERRVARHVLAIRPHLTAEQQRSLMGLCAEGVRENAGRRRGWGWEGRGDDGAGAPGGPGRRGGHGGGPGRGHGGP